MRSAHNMIAGGALLALAGAAWAPDILHAYYDSANDAIVARIAYRGEHPDHDYILQWGECKDGGHRTSRRPAGQGAGE